MVKTAFRELIATCDTRVRSHLKVGEQVLAIGRAEDATEGESAGAGWTFLMVTDRAVRWIPNLNLKLEASLALESVTGATEQMVAHRYTLDLEHHPITRLHHVPAHRFLVWEWGNDFAYDVFTRTSIAFSQRDTAAASALRERLNDHGLLEAEPSRSGAAEEPFTPPSGL
jgi:hypothetical protein